MDPLSQGLAGGLLAQVAAGKDNFRPAFILGFLAALLPDLDVLIRSDVDPILSLEYHRHFTHSLIFVPLGGLLAAGIAWLVMKRQLSFSKIYLFTTLGYLSHGALDACTSYGTHLLWPFSQDRTAWNIVSIIDPILTGTVLLLSLLALVLKKKGLLNFGLVFALLYLSLGMVQRERAELVAAELISRRGHQASRISVKPSIGNILLWRIVYRHQNSFFTDAVQLAPFREPKVYQGEEVSAVDIKTELADINPNSQLAKDLRRFAFFSDNYLCFHPQERDVIGDLRYATLPNSSIPLLGIRFDRNKPDQHVRHAHFRRADKGAFSSLFRMLARE